MRGTGRTPGPSGSFSSRHEKGAKKPAGGRGEGARFARHTQEFSYICIHVVALSLPPPPNSGGGTGLPAGAIAAGTEARPGQALPQPVWRVVTLCCRELGGVKGLSAGFEKRRWEPAPVKQYGLGCGAGEGCLMRDTKRFCSSFETLSQ